MEQAYAALSSAAEEGELTTDLHEDINNTNEAPSSVSPASDTTATDSNEYYFVGYLGEEIDNQRWRGDPFRSGRAYMSGIMHHSCSCRPAAALHV